MQRPIIMINTDNYPTFCDNRCSNTECSKHFSRAMNHSGGCKISKLRDTEECEGCIPVRRKKETEEIEEIL